MKKQVMILLAGALLAISSCSKSNSTTSVNPPVNTNVPYWGNNQQLSASNNDKMMLTVVSVPVSESNPVTYTVTSHITYAGQDYLVTNIDSVTNSPVSPYLYQGHKISIIGNGASYTGTYTATTFYASNIAEATFVLTIYPSAQPMVFGSLMYTGQGNAPTF